MPVWGIWLDSVFYFSTGRQSRKAKNLEANAKCVLCNERIDEAVIVEGVAEEVRDAGLLAKLSRPYYAKYKPWKLEPDRGPVYAVRACVVFGMYEKEFTRTATRWTF
jgi:hypothetical protein